MTLAQSSRFHKPKPIQGATAKVYKCEMCKDTQYHLDVDLMGAIFAEPCPVCAVQESAEPAQVMDARCQVFNSLQLSAETPFDKIEPLLTRKGIKPPFLSAIRSFCVEWPQKKKEIRKAEIISNPDDHSIVRPVDQFQVTSLHLHARNAIFQIINQHDRAKLTEKTAAGTDIDVVLNRAFVGWGGNLEFVISGPVLCMFDQQVYYACLKIHHNNGFKGINLSTNLCEIWRAMERHGSMGSDSIKALKRSLSRLHKVSIEVSSIAKGNSCGSFWGGGIFDSVKFEAHKNPKLSKVIISFNRNFVPQYLSGAYSTLYLPHLNKLKAYARRMYEFLMSHNDVERKMSLEKWREVFGIDENVPPKTFRQRVKEAVAELVEYGILQKESGIFEINGKSMILTFLDPIGSNTEKAGFQ
jgi:hypothetical protein